MSVMDGLGKLIDRQEVGSKILGRVSFFNLGEIFSPDLLPVQLAQFGVGITHLERIDQGVKAFGDALLREVRRRNFGALHCVDDSFSRTVKGHRAVGAQCCYRVAFGQAHRWVISCEPLSVVAKARGKALKVVESVDQEGSFCDLASLEIEQIRCKTSVLALLELLQVGVADDVGCHHYGKDLHAFILRAVIIQIQAGCPGLDRQVYLVLTWQGKH